MSPTAPLGDQIRAIVKCAEGELILVGGQALGVWVEYFDVVDKLTQAVTSIDIDFLGRLQTAKRLAEHMKGELKIPEPFDPTPHAARIKVLDENGTPIEIDILKSVFGFATAKEIRAHAILIGEDGLLIMHPVHVLKSRLKNTLELAGGYASPRGLGQARAAVLCVAGFLRQRAADNPKDACHWARIVANWAHDTTLGHRAFVVHGIDLLDAIPINAMPSKFRDQEWSHLLLRIRKRRGL